tara:strand:+ start:1287 stop:2126 length:840 start_codon:yes stop_codon:yes gene_type:complete
MSNFLNFSGNQGVTFKDHGTGGGTSFTLDVNASTNSVMLSIGGVMQSPVVDYTVSGTTVTTTSSVTSGVEVLSYVIHKPGTAPTIQDNSISNAKMLDDAVGLAELSATGTPSSSNFLRGDNAWAAAGGGKVLQVLGASKTDVASTTSTSMADTGLSVAITPAATSSKILVTGNAVFSTNANSHYFYAQFVRDTTALAIGDAAGSRIRAWIGGGVDHATNSYASGFSYLDSPSSTSELTYKLQFKSQTGTVVYLNSSYTDVDNNGSLRGGSSIVVMEIGA